jgi:hypothetical protein
MSGNPEKRRHSTIVPFKTLRDFGIEFTRIHVNRMVEQGSFPPPRRLSPHRVGRLQSDIEKWLAALPLARAPRAMSHGEPPLADRKSRHGR